MDSKITARWGNQEYSVVLQEPSNYMLVVNGTPTRPASDAEIAIYARLRDMTEESDDWMDRYFTEHQRLQDYSFLIEDSIKLFRLVASGTLSKERAAQVLGDTLKKSSLEDGHDRA